MTKVKGNLLYHMKKLVISKYGNETFLEILNNSGVRSRECFKAAIISGDWYDFELYENFLEGVINVLGIDELEKLNSELAKTQFTGIFGFFLNLVNPGTVIKKSPSLFKKVFSEGEFKVEEMKDNRIMISISGFDISDGSLIGIKEYLKAIISIIFKKENVTSKAFKKSDKVYLYEYFWQ